VRDDETKAGPLTESERRSNKAGPESINLSLTLIRVHLVLEQCSNVLQCRRQRPDENSSKGQNQSIAG